jgi:NADH dehydrogenase
MRITLLGATGFVGHHLLPALSSAGHECLVLTRYRPACRDLSVIPRVEVVQTDVYDAENLERYFATADAVVNMVGILNESGRKGEGFKRAHVELVEKILAACRAQGVKRLVHVSALNAGKGRSHYLVSKGLAEDLIRAADDIDYTILQPSVIFGDGDAFFNRFASLLKLAPVLPLACPDSKMQPVWAGDVTSALCRSLAGADTINQTLVLVGPHVYSLRDLLEFTACAAGLKRRIIGLPDGLSRLQGRLMDFVPGKPFSSDNYLSLKIDNCSVENSLWRFGIRPRSIESIVPMYLRGSSHQHQLDDCRKQVED